MKPKIADEVPAEAWELLGKIRQIIDALPASIETPAYVVGVRVSPDVAISHIIPNCHVIARALANFFPVDVHDGTVSVLGEDGRERRLNHSWLTLRDHDGLVIIDPWPLGVVSGPALFFQNYAYHFGPECSFLEHSGEKFESEVKATIEAMQMVIK
jgi:hypothetical protein